MAVLMFADLEQGEGGEASRGKRADQGAVRGGAAPGGLRAERVSPNARSHGGGCHPGGMASCQGEAPAPAQAPARRQVLHDTSCPHGPHYPV